MNVNHNSKSIAEVSNSTTILDKLNALHITPALGASILSGLVQTNIYAQYLHDWNGHLRNAAQTTLLYTMTTVEEEIKEYATSHQTYPLPATMDKPTHIVTGITWGAQFLFAIREPAANPNDLAREQESLDSAFENLNNAPSETWIWSNVLSPRLLPSLPSSKTLIDKFDTYLKSTNSGKGAPISYTLTPLHPQSRPHIVSNLIAPTMYQPKPIHLDRFFNLLDDMADARQRVREFIARCTTTATRVIGTATATATATGTEGPGATNTTTMPNHQQQQPPPPNHATLVDMQARVDASLRAEDWFRMTFGRFLKDFRHGVDRDPQNLALLISHTERDNSNSNPKAVLSVLIPPLTAGGSAAGQELVRAAFESTIPYAAWKETFYALPGSQRWA